jgi:hypothetical protein
MAVPAVPQPGFETYHTFIDDELTELRAVKDSLESRGAAVITSAGAFVTLLFAVVALISGREKYDLPDNAHFWLYMALGLFFVAGLLALFISMPLLYRAPTTRGLDSVVRQRWDDDDKVASRRVAVTKLD